MQLYTKTGDKGKTGLYGGGRVSKDDLRIEMCGTLDELNTFLGLAVADLKQACVLDFSGQADFVKDMEPVQVDLFVMGSQIGSSKSPKVTLEEKDINRLEKWIDAYEAKLPPLKNFILPGGDRGGAFLHVCRAVCRRAERLGWKLHKKKESKIPKEILIYLNRLSDLLFVWARFANQLLQVPETVWETASV